MGKNNKIKPALLVIDIQNFSLKFIPDKDKEAALARINMYIELFRNHDFPIIRIYHFSKQHGLTQGTEDFEFPKSIKPFISKIVSLILQSLKPVPSILLSEKSVFSKSHFSKIALTLTLPH